MRDAVTRIVAPLGSSVLLAVAALAVGPGLGQIDPIRGVSAQVQSDPPTGWPPEYWLRIKRLGRVDVSADGKYVAVEVGTYVAEGERSELVRQIEVGPSSAAPTVRVTQGDVSSFAPAWSPDGDWIGYLTARTQGAEVWIMRPDGSDARRVTNAEGTVVAFQWSPDGSQIAYLAVDPQSQDEARAEREKRDARVVDANPKLTRLYVVDVANNGERAHRMLSGDRSISYPIFSFGALFDWSPDGSEIAFTHQPTPSSNDWPRADISVAEVKSGTLRSLVSTSASEWTVNYSPDGEWIAYAASDDPPTWGFSFRVHVVPSSGGVSRPLAESYDGKPTIVGWSADSKEVLIWEPRKTESRISALPLTGGPPVDLSPPGLYPGRPSVNGSGSHLGFTVEATDRPAEAWVSGAETFRPVQVSRVQDPALASVGPTEVVSWQAPDGKTIEGLVTYPLGYVAGAPVPLLVYAHGGPTGVFSQSFIGATPFYPVASFSAEGYAVLRPNVRGGSGYGHDFRYANYGDWGGGDFSDLISGVDALVERGIADPDRLGIMGWSYGGFMASWTTTQTNRFKAASVGAGMTELLSFTGTTDLPDFVPDYLGNFPDSQDFWRERSPVLNVHPGMTTPTLIQHGEQDERVPLSQGEQLYRALRYQDVETEMVVYPRQGHVPREPKLMLHVLQSNLDWFKRWIPVR